MKIATHEERKECEMGFTITRQGGPHDGHVWRPVKATLDDGSKLRLWKSNQLEGYYKQVFVPWDFEHQSIIDM